MARPKGTIDIPPEKRYELCLEKIRAGELMDDYYIKTAQGMFTKYADHSFSRRALDEALCEGCPKAIEKCKETIALGLGSYAVGKYNKRIKSLEERLERARERLRREFLDNHKRCYALLSF
jgi:hypothetical protein